MIGTLLLNRYELLEKIGEGGMGIVYKARCALLDRLVAVKILKPELNDNEDFITRFKREANSIAKLSNPNIVSIYDVGSENNINFIVMEYINGETLKQLIRKNVRFSPLGALNIALQIAKALECAHKNNIIHRDIKPDNILITDGNIAKLTDFGIAKISDSVTLTNSNKIIGSVHYFSPEQAKGKFVDHRTDIYALGIVMYEMITGQVPYNSESSISVAMMHIQEPVVPPKKVITDIPENINQIILKSLEKEPINRFQTAKEFAEILNKINDNPNLEVNFNNKSMDDSTIMVDSDKILSDTEIDPTVVMNQETVKFSNDGLEFSDNLTKVMTQVTNLENLTVKKDRKKLLRNNNLTKKKKIMLIGLIILAMSIGILGKYLSKESSENTEVTIAETTNTETAVPEETTVPEEITELPKDEGKLVPSLIGTAQDVAENTIVNNGFSVGNITSEYSDTVPKGSIISQSPVADTYYEKDGKIDLVISQGKRAVTQAASQVSQSQNQSQKDSEKQNQEEKVNEKDKEKQEKEIGKYKEKNNKSKNNK